MSGKVSDGLGFGLVLQVLSKAGDFCGIRRYWRNRAQIMGATQGLGPRVQHTARFTRIAQLNGAYISGVNSGAYPSETSCEFHSVGSAISGA